MEETAEFENKKDRKGIDKQRGDVYNGNNKR